MQIINVYSKEDQLFGVISKNPIKIGDALNTNIAGNGVDLHITKIVEQRKGKGTYADESQRPYWAKVSTKR